MKSEISNALIKRIYENAGTPIRKELEKEVPELFKPKFKVGDWVYGANSEMVSRVESIKENHLCVDCGGKWDMDRYVRLATDKEIEKHLISIWEGMGGKEGDRVANAVNGNQFTIKAECKYKYNQLTDELDIIFNYTEWTLYKQGKWAEIIKEESPIELTIADIAKLKGVDVSRIRIVE